MKNKTPLCLLFYFFYFLFHTLGDMYLKMPLSNIFCTDFENASMGRFQHSLLVGGIFMILVYGQLHIFTRGDIAQH